MQKCPTIYMESSSIDRNLVKLFRRKLENLSVSDYYGLKSPGLTCYLNSVLQVLFMTEDFREAVKRRCSKQPAALDQHLEQLFCELERRRAETHNVTEQLGIIDVYEQRDAAEYFEKILCQTSSEASTIFKGELNHKTMCRECSKTNNFKSFFWVLPLSMDNSSRENYSVQQGLEDFFKEQKVSEENQMFCDICNKKQDADIKYEVTQSPDVLTLLLKRFTFDDTQSRYIKLHRTADVVPTLNLQNCRYDLYAVVHHYGFLTGGHYTAEIKSFETGNWYCFNDNTVKHVKQHDFELEKNLTRSSTAYLLMYKKVRELTRRTDGRDLKAQRVRSDVQTEDGWDESELRSFPVSDYHLKNESCRGGNYKHLNGEIPSDYVFGRKRTCSLRREKKQPNQRAGLVGLQTDPEAPQQETKNHRSNVNSEKTPDAHFRLSTFLQDSNSVVKGQRVNKTGVYQNNFTETHLSNCSATRHRITSSRTEVVDSQTEAAVRRREMLLKPRGTSVRDVGYSPVKTRGLCSSLPSPSPCSCCHRRAKEDGLKRNKTQKQLIEDTKHGSLKTETKREKSTSQTETRSVNMSENKGTRKAWR